MRKHLIAPSHPNHCGGHRNSDIYGLIPLYPIDAPGRAEMPKELSLCIAIWRRLDYCHIIALSRRGSPSGFHNLTLVIGGKVWPSLVVMKPAMHSNTENDILSSMVTIGRMPEHSYSHRFKRLSSITFTLSSSWFRVAILSLFLDMLSYLSVLEEGVPMGYCAPGYFSLKFPTSKPPLLDSKIP